MKSSFMSESKKAKENKVLRAVEQTKSSNERIANVERLSPIQKSKIEKIENVD